MTKHGHEVAYAKLNLALHVRARRPDGHHDIETLFAFAEAGDALSAEQTRDISLEISGPYSASLDSSDDNLVLRAARAFKERAGVTDGARLHLVKNLPVASGVGGGSADAAAALRLLRTLWSLDLSDETLRQVAAGLGADLPACVESRTVIGTGKGDRLQDATHGFERAPILLVNPGIPLATGSVFAGWDGQDHGPIDPSDPASWRNDLTESAVALVPEVGACLRTLERQPGLIMARMSGSGATCFAIFEDNAARDAAADVFPDLWTLATRLRSR